MQMSKELSSELKKTMMQIFAADLWPDQLVKAREIVERNRVQGIVSELVETQGWREKSLAAVIVTAFEREDLIEFMLDDFEECPFSGKKEGDSYAEMVYQLKGVRGRKDLERIAQKYDEQKCGFGRLDLIYEKLSLRPVK